MAGSIPFSVQEGEPAIRDGDLFSTVFNLASDAIFLHTPTTDGCPGTFIDANCAACDMLGYSRDELLAMGPRDIVPEELHSQLEGIVRQSRAIPRVCFETRLKRKDGTTFPAESSGHLVPCGNRMIWISIIRDISGRKKVELALRESEMKFRTLFEDSFDGLFITSPEGKILDMNKKGISMFGYDTIDEIRRLDLERDVYAYPPDRKRILAMVNARGSAEYEVTVRKKDGTRIDTHCSLTAVRDKAGTITAYRGIIRDITEKKMAEEALRRANAYNRSLIEASLDPLVTIGPDGRITDVNASTEAATGYSRDRLIGTDFSRYFTEPEQAKAGYLRVFSDGGIQDYPLEIRHRDGTIIPVLYNATVFRDETGTIAGVFAAARDITERRLAEDELRNSRDELEIRVVERTDMLRKINRKLLKEIDERKRAQMEVFESLHEKDLLLREVHHRVKNNLQIITSMLNLQSRYIRDERTLAAIRESQARVKAMAIVHERLYHSGDISRIYLDDYIRFLSMNLVHFFGHPGREVHFSMDVAKIPVDINTIIPLGLILNELISNSLKYAFPGRNDGEIAISVRETDHCLTIRFADNGIGLPEDFDWRNTDSLGLRLVISLVEQLDGTIDLDRSAGSAFTMVVTER